MPSPYGGQNWRRPERVQGMSSRKPTTTAPMNNNPMGNQQTMTPQNAATMVPPIAPVAPVAPTSPAPQLPMVRPTSPPSNIPPSTPANIGNASPQGQIQPATRPNIRIPGSRGPLQLPGPVSIPMTTVSPMPSRSMAQSDFGRALVDNVTNSAPQAGVLQPGARNPVMTADPFEEQAPQTPPANAQPQARPAGTLPPETQAQFARTDEAMRALDAMGERLRPATQNIRGLQQSTMQSLNRPIERNRIVAAGGTPGFTQEQLSPLNRNGLVPDGMGRMVPRSQNDLTGARNVLSGQNPDANTSMRALNIPGTYMDQNGVQRSLYNPGGGYGPNGQGVVPGSVQLPPGNAQALDQARALARQNNISPDEFRALTGGQALIPRENLRPTPSVGDGLLTRTPEQRMTRMARQRGVRAADIPAWIDRRRAASQGFARGGTPSANAMGGSEGGASAITPGMAQQTQAMTVPDQEPNPNANAYIGLNNWWNRNIYGSPAPRVRYQR